MCSGQAKGECRTSNRFFPMAGSWSLKAIEKEAVVQTMPLTRIFS